MMNPASYTREQSLPFAAVVSQAHKVLTALLRGEPLQELNAAVLHWLSERELVEEILGDGEELELEITQKGREAVLGRRQRVIH